MARRKPWSPSRATPASSRLLRGEPRGPAARGSTNEATAQRYSRAPDGIHVEAISSYKRERVGLPMTLLPVLMGKTIDDLHAARTGEKPDEPPLRKTRLDRALDHDETGSLRWALSRYVCNVLAVQRRRPSPKALPGSNKSGIPFSAAGQAALRRLAYSHGRLSARDRAVLDQFAVMMGAIHPALAPISLAGLGRELRGLSDDKISEGVAVERILSLAERLDAINRGMPTL